MKRAETTNRGPDSEPDEKNETHVVNRIIEDTSVPKTYRAMFARYLKWKNKQKEGH